MPLSAAAPISSLSCEQSMAALQSSQEGLSSNEALQGQLRGGRNRLPPQRRRPLLLRLTEQFTHFMALLLWVAGGMAFLARTPELGWAIWSVVLINALFSFWQDFQAERTLAALSNVLPRQVRGWSDVRLRILSADPPWADVMSQPPRHRDQPLLDRPLLRQAYLFLGLLEAALAMLGYGLTWWSHGIAMPQLRAIAPALLHHEASAELVALQHQASAMALGSIVFAQVGTALVCRGGNRFKPNALLWLGIAVELIAFLVLQSWPPLAHTFQMAPIPSQLWWWLLLCIPAPLLANRLHITWRARHHGSSAVME